MLHRHRASGIPSWPAQGKTCPLTLAMVLASCKQNPLEKSHHCHHDSAPGSAAFAFALLFGLGSALEGGRQLKWRVLNLNELVAS